MSRIVRTERYKRGVFGWTAREGSNETIIVGNGNDNITIGSADNLTVGNGNNQVSAGSDDQITIGNGNDSISTGAGDTLQAARCVADASSPGLIPAPLATAPGVRFSWWSARFPDRLEDAWASYSEAERFLFLRTKLGSIERALSPEQRDELIARYVGEQAALYPPEPPASNGAGDIDLIRQCDRVKRKTRDSDTLDLCSLIERAISERRVAACAGR
jgi:Ca2+-binding RTX toxin-like protein